ncbi:hypothetical protein Tco_0105604 [Tanacetum coccineum]
MVFLTCLLKINNIYCLEIAPFINDMRPVLKFEQIEVPNYYVRSISKGLEVKEAEAARLSHSGHSSGSKVKTRITSKDYAQRCQSFTTAEQEAKDHYANLRKARHDRRQPVGIQKQESEYSEEDQLSNEEKDDKDDDVDDEVNDYIRDDEDADDEDVETKSDEDDIYKYKIRVRKDEDEEMLNVEAEDSGKGDEEVTDATKANVEKTSEVKDDAKKTELPPTRSSLSVSSGFGDQFLKLSFDASLVGTAKDSTDAEISSLLDVKIQSKVPRIQSPSQAPVNNSTFFIYLYQPPAPQQHINTYSTPAIITDAPTITTVVFESNALSVVQLRVAKLEKDISELKKIDLFVEALTALKIQVPSFVDNYLRPKVGGLLKETKETHRRSYSEIFSVANS